LNAIRAAVKQVMFEEESVKFVNNVNSLDQMVINNQENNQGASSLLQESIVEDQQEVA